MTENEFTLETFWAAWGAAAGNRQPIPGYHYLEDDFVPAAVWRWHQTSPEGYGSVELNGVLEGRDGTFLTIEAWADTTGWGCQDGGAVRFAKTYHEAIKFGLSREAREVLGIYTVE